MRFFLIALLGVKLFAGDLLGKVRDIIGPQSYGANRQIIRTLFSNSAKYYKNGRIDFAMVCRVLERTSLLPKSFAFAKEQSIIFISEDRAILTMKIVDMALKRAGIFNAKLQEIEWGEFFKERFLFLSRQALQPSSIVSALERIGAKVVDLRYEGGWKFYLDMDFAKLAAKRVALPKRFETLHSPLWLDVCGLGSVKIKAFSRWWHPAIYIYDASLNPLETIFKERTQSLTISLPKGSCYIKIADKFTIKNIKRGFLIEGF